MFLSDKSLVPPCSGEMVNVYGLRGEKKPVNFACFSAATAEAATCATFPLRTFTIVHFYLCSVGPLSLTRRFAQRTAFSRALWITSYRHKTRYRVLCPLQMSRKASRAKYTFFETCKHLLPRKKASRKRCFHMKLRPKA